MPKVIPFRRKGLNLTRIIADGSLIPDVQKPNNKTLSKERREELTKKLWPVSNNITPDDADGEPQSFGVGTNIPKPVRPLLKRHKTYEEYKIAMEKYENAMDRYKQVMNHLCKGLPRGVKKMKTSKDPQEE